MAESHLDAVAFDKFFRLLELMLPQAAGFVALGVDGQLLAGSADAPAISSWNENDGLHLITLTARSGEHIGYLGAQLGLESETQTAGASASRLLDQVAACITCEHDLTAELNDLASELGERYEELNLLYTGGGESNDTDVDQDDLDRLVQSCITHLGVEAVSLAFHDRIMSISRMGGADTDAEVEARFIPVHWELDLWFQNEAETVVLNKEADWSRLNLCAKVPWRVMACPLLDERGGVIGSLIGFRGEDGADFSTGDRKLLKAMAEKGEKIVQAGYDSLTGLSNRRMFEKHLQGSLKSRRFSDVGQCLMELDIDELRVINDTLGRNAGDEVIRQVSGLLTKHLRDTDVLSYFGSGKFGVLLENCTLRQAHEIGEELRQAVAGLPMRWDGEQLPLSVSVGIAQAKPNGEAQGIMEAVELACDAAKELGKDRVQVFSEGDIDFTRRRGQMEWVRRIQAGLRENRFRIYCQEIQPLSRCDEQYHFEVLLRYADDAGNILSPLEFMPAAERYNLMPALDRWVVREVLRSLAAAGGHFRSMPGVCAINVSGQSLGDAGFVQYVLEQLEESGLPGSRICFEITETSAIRNEGTAMAFISALKEQGCHFSLDDFGTGLSSFAYLRKFPVDYLKIDGSFVSHIVTDPIADAMVSAINQVGHVMGLKTIAEYVEDEPIRRRLVSMGVDFVQGFAIGRPRPIDGYLRMLCSMATQRAG